MERKNVLVTGASKGIGKSIAMTLVDAGYNVYICARNDALLKQVVLEIGASGYFVADLTKSDACKTLVDSMLRIAGSIDVLINNAADYVYSTVEKTTEEAVTRLLALNIAAPFLLAKHIVPSMKKNNWGRVVNIGSISGVVGEANASLYSMTKSSLIGFTKALALELAQDNITVNTISPGWVDTGLAENAVSASDFTYEEEIDMIPQRRFIQPIEIANLVKYLISDDAKGLTGQNVSLCAGLSVG